MLTMNMRTILPPSSRAKPDAIEGLASIPHDTYLSAADVAARTPFSLKSLEKKRALGLGPKCSIVGRRVVYKWADVVAWIEGSGR
jgi:hypothetical protein